MTDEEYRPASLFGDQEVALVDLLDRLLAGVDLVRVSLRALITSIAPVAPAPGPLRDVTAVVDRPALGAGDG